MILRSFAKWLAAITGAEAEIRKDERQNIGYRIKDASYWFTNHTLYGRLYPFLMYLGCRIETNLGVYSDTARTTWEDIQKCQTLYDAGEGWNEFRYNDVSGCLKFNEWSKEEV